MPKLIFTGEHFARRVYELTLEKTTVGRGDHNTLAFHDPSVSQSHCEILVHGPEVIVCDLGSANGTFVNGVRLDHQQCQMKSGQMIRFGTVQARLDLGTPIWEDTASEESAVFAARRFARAERQAEEALKPASASATFGSDPDPDWELSTVLLAPTEPMGRMSTPPVPQKSEVRPRKPGLLILLVVALVLGLAFWLWLIWGNK